MEVACPNNLLSWRDYGQYLSSVISPNRPRELNFQISRIIVLSKFQKRSDLLLIGKLSSEIGQCSEMEFDEDGVSSSADGISFISGVPTSPTIQERGGNLGFS
jgi:hypothetical protein